MNHNADIVVLNDTKILTRFTETEKRDINVLFCYTIRYRIYICDLLLS